MAKGQDLNLPTPPEYQMDDIFSQGYKSLFDYGSQLSRGDFSGNLSWLQPLLNPNNSANALAYAQNTLQPQFRDTLQQIRNEAANSGSLESSTFTDALARSQSDLNSNYQAILSQQAINDSNQANANRFNLFGTGLNVLNQATAFGKSNQDTQNQFNLQNYDNLVAQSIQNNKNANKANGWQQFGAMINPFYHDYLGSQGINNVPGYGVGELAQIAAPFMGFGGAFGQGGAFGASMPGQYASN